MSKSQPQSNPHQELCSICPSSRKGNLLFLQNQSAVGHEAACRGLWEGTFSGTLGLRNPVVQGKTFTERSRSQLLEVRCEKTGTGTPGNLGRLPAISNSEINPGRGREVYMNFQTGQSKVCFLSHKN